MLFTRADVRFLTRRLGRGEACFRTSDTLHCGFTGSGPVPEAVLSSRPSGRVCLVVSTWRRRGCANKNTNGNWSGQSSALLIWTRIGAPLAGVNPSLSSPLTPPMQFDPAPIPLWAWLLRCSQCAVCSVQCAFACPGQPPTPTFQPGGRCPLSAVQDSRWQPVAPNPLSTSRTAQRPSIHPPSAMRP
jgi:hypothetical protein